MLGSAAAGFIFPSCRPGSFANGEDEVCQFLKIFFFTEISILIRHDTGKGLFNLSENCVPICQLFLKSEQVKSFNTRQQLNYLSVCSPPSLYTVFSCPHKKTKKTNKRGWYCDVRAVLQCFYNWPEALSCLDSSAGLYFWYLYVNRQIQKT